MSTIKVIGLTYLFLLSIIGLMTVIPILLQMASAQTPNQTPTTTIQGNNLGNLRFVPQDAIVTTLPPKGFESQSQGVNIGEGGIVGTIIAAVSLGGVIWNKLGLNKTKETTQNIAATQVKMASVDKAHAEQTYENMQDKGTGIINKPEIKLENLEKIKQEAIDNAAKA